MELFNYKFNLFRNDIIYSVFYISLLEPIDLETFIQDIFYFKSMKEYIFEIEKILK